MLTLTPDHNSQTAERNAKDIQLFGGNSRIPILMVGPLLHTIKTARILNLGGCKIGDRPIDYHLNALRKFGANVTKDDASGITLEVPEDGLKGTDIELTYPSVGATEQVLLTAVRAQGKTVLKNAAIEPEIIDLIAVLQKMGAIIFVNDNRTIVIEGVDELTGYDHTALPDRNEAASWASDKSNKARVVVLSLPCICDHNSMCFSPSPIQYRGIGRPFSEVPSAIFHCS